MPPPFVVLWAAEALRRTTPEAEHTNTLLFCMQYQAPPTTDCGLDKRKMRLIK
jgi:hypothetical protein